MKSVSRLMALLLALLFIFHVTAFAIGADPLSDASAVSTPIPQEELNEEILATLSYEAEAAVAAIKDVRGMGITANAATINFRKEAHGFSEVIAEIPEGTFVSVYDTTGVSFLGEWYKVRYNEMDGFIHNSRIRVCSCEIEEDDGLESHIASCPDKLFYEAVCELSAVELYTRWDSFTEKGQQYILLYLKENALEKLFDLQARFDGKIIQRFDKYSFELGGSLPENGVLEVKAVSEEVITKISDVLVFDQLGVGDRREIYAFDLKVLQNDEVWQPAEGGISITIPNLAPDADKVEIIHLLDSSEGIAAAERDGTLQIHTEPGLVKLFPEECKAAGSEEKICYVRNEVAVNEFGDVTFVADSFSSFYFSVDFYFDGKTYEVLEPKAGTTVLLSTIFDKLNIDRINDVQSVVFSDPLLISIEKETDDWKLTILNVFNNEELLTVTYSDGTKQLIKVINMQEILLSSKKIEYIDGTGAVDEEAYEKMLSEATSRYNSSNGGNIPITNWKRSTSPLLFPIPGINDNIDLQLTWRQLSSIMANSNHVWDGSRLIRSGNDYKLNQYSSRLYDIEWDDAKVKEPKITAGKKGEEYILYDSATWDCLSQNGTAMYNLNRFTGEVTLANDPNDLIYQIGNQVGGMDHLHMNDDIFIFIYPKGKTLSDNPDDENYFMKYFACWAGTSANAGRQMIERFNGVKYSSAAVQDTTEGYFQRLTDWKMTNVTKAVTDVIRKSYNELVDANKVATLVIDVFVGECAGNGGMYRPVLIASQDETKTYARFKVVCEDHVENAVPNVRYELTTKDEHPATSKASSNIDGELILVASNTAGATIRQIYAGDGFVLNNDKEYLLSAVVGDEYRITNAGVTSDCNNTDNKYILKVVPQDNCVTFKANGGTFDGVESDRVVEYCACGYCSDQYMVPVRAGYQFAGWKVTEANGTWVLGAQYGTDVNEKLAGTYGNATLTAQWEAVYSDLTIVKQDANLTLDPNHAFIFNVVGTPLDGSGEINIQVVINGNDETTIARLPIGTYTVTEMDAWSWRYTATSKVGDDATYQVTLVTPEEPQTITFTNTRGKTKWLDGNAETKENNFNAVSSGSSSSTTKELSMDAEDELYFVPTYH